MIKPSEKYIPFLKSVLLLWPKRNELNTSAYLKDISNKVHVNFDETDLLVGFTDGCNFKIISSSSNYAVIEFEDSKSYPYRAKVVESNGELFLESLKFQCPVCFGTGINEGSECMMCAGLGWGAG